MKQTTCLAALFAVLMACPVSSIWADPVLTYTNGNTFIPGSSTGLAVSGTSDGWLSFTAPEAMDATGIRVDLSSVVVADNVTLTYELELGSGGVPDGTPIESGTITPTVTGFDEVDFASSTPLTAGSVYYVVVQASAAGDSIRETGTTTASTQPYGFIDNNFEIGAKTTAFPADGLNIVLVTDNGSYNPGNSISGLTNVAMPTSGALSLTQHFVFEPPATGNSISSATFRLAIGATIGSSVTFTLEDNSNNVLATTTELASAFTLSATNNYTVNFTNVPALTLGAAYNFVISGAGVSWVADVTDTNAADELATYEGTQGYAIGGTTGTTVENNEDYIFSYATDTVVVPEPNSLTLGFLGLGGLAGLMFLRRNKSV
jgi:PEP-CTERM motif